MSTESTLCFTINRLSYHTTGWLLLDKIELFSAWWHNNTYVYLSYLRGGFMGLLRGVEGRGWTDRQISHSSRPASSYRTYNMNFRSKKSKKKNLIRYSAVYMTSLWNPNFVLNVPFYDAENISLSYLLSGVGNVTRLGAGRSWVQIPASVKDIWTHPASYSKGTSIDGKVNECSRTATRPICNWT